MPLKIPNKLYCYNYYYLIFSNNTALIIMMIKTITNNNIIIINNDDDNEMIMIINYRIKLLINVSRKYMNAPCPTMCCSSNIFLV